MHRSLSAVVLALFVSSLSAAPVLLRNPLPIPFHGTITMGVWTADFDGDGHADILVLHPGATLEVFLSRGAGNFASVETPITDVVEGLTIADIDGDGHADVIYTRWGPPSAIVVLRGTGAGSFNAYVTVATVQTPGPVAVADFNGDGKQDIAVVQDDTHNTNNLGVIQLGDGNGGFGPPMTFSESTQTYSRPEGMQILAADLNGDGMTDIVLQRRYNGQVLLGNGTGAFVPTSSLWSDRVVSIADLNSDGKPDLLLNGAGGAMIALGPGDGTFTFGPAVPTGTTDALNVVEVDGDGKQDIVGVAASAVTFCRGNGDGTLAAPQFFLSGPGAFRVVTGDFDWDGLVDAVTFDYNATIPALSLLHGNGDGTFRAHRAFSLGAAAASWSAATADMNGDGKLDIVTLTAHAATSTVDIAVLAGDGNAHFAPLTYTNWQQQIDFSGVYFAVGDVNGDSHPDVVLLATFNGISTGATFLGNGDGTFQAPVAISPGGDGRPYLVDLNHDGHLDLFIGGLPSYSLILFGNGDGSFASPGSTSAGFSASFADVNGDGNPDLVLTNTYDVVVGLNDGHGAFTFTSLGEYDPQTCVVGDFDGDGHADILVMTYDRFRFRHGNGDGTFADGQAFFITPLPDGPLATADFDGDGNLDLASGTTIYLGNGHGTFRSLSRFRANPVGNISIGDFNGDGAPDLAFIDTNAFTVNILTVDRQTQQALGTSTQLVSNTASPQYATPIKFTATVTGSVWPETGTILFSVDDVPYSLTELANASASLSVGLAVGSHSVVATYGGDDNYAGSSASLAQTVSKAQTSLSVSAGPNPTPAGTTVTFTRTIYASRWAGLAGPTGDVVYSENGVPLPTTSTPYPESQSISTLSVGTHHILATYPGDANYLSSTASFDEVITKPVPYMSITFSPSPVIAGQPFAIVVTFAPSFVDATGTIALQMDAAPLTTLTISGGTVQYTSSLPSWSAHVVSASYSGDAKYAAATASAQLVVNVAWGTPLEIRATATNVSWSHVAGAASYTIYHKTSFAGAWVGQTYPNTMISFWPAIPSGSTWMFAASATDGNGTQTAMSAPDIATNVGFVDNPLVPGVTIVKLQHLTQVRLAVDAVRAFAGLPMYSYSPVVAGQVIRTTDVMELRDALSAARSAIGMPVGFSDPVLTPGDSPIRAVHVQEIRAGTD